MPSKKGTKSRGPSRPIDPRYAPGRPVRRGPDRFGMTLIGLSLAGVLIIILIASLAAGNNTTTTTTTTNPAASAPGTTPNVMATESVFVQSVESLPRVSPADAKSEYDAKTATIIDVRDIARYKTEHIKGSTNIPYTEAQTRLAEFPKTGNLIVYCQ